MQLKINQEVCNKCNHCSDFFSGFPHIAYTENYTIPDWICQDNLILKCVFEVVEVCETQAISILYD